MSDHYKVGSMPDAMERLCDQCAHAFDPHRVISTTGDPTEGGIMLCPIPGCPCYSTWSFGKDKDEPVFVPDRVEVELIREQIQAEQ